MKMAPKESFRGKERGKENGSLGGIFFIFIFSVVSAAQHRHVILPVTTLAFPTTTHTRIPTREEQSVLEERTFMYSSN